MKVLDEYATHHYFTEYELNSELYCPNCGKKEVWTEQSEGDYYTGATNLCLHCEHYFSIQGPSTIESPNRRRILDQLRAQKTLKPNTPKGN